MREMWTPATREAFKNAVPLPDGVKPKYFVAAPTDVTLNKAMKAIGWLRVAPYAPFVAPDGNTVSIAFSRITLRQREDEHAAAIVGGIKKKGPHGTLFVLWPNGKIPPFHADRMKMIDAAIKDPLWIVCDLPSGEA